MKGLGKKSKKENNPESAFALGKTPAKGHATLIFCKIAACPLVVVGVLGCKAGWKQYRLRIIAAEEHLQLMKGLFGGWYQKAEISLGTCFALHACALLC